MAAPAYNAVAVRMTFSTSRATLARDKYRKYAIDIAHQGQNVSSPLALTFNGEK